MTKRILILCALMLVSAYLVVAVTAFNGRPDKEVCQGMELSIKDSTDYGFVTTSEIKSMLKGRNIYPEGKTLQLINVRRLEEVLSQHPFVGTAECYLTSGGKVAIDIYQRIPIMRVMAHNGDDYYIDDEGNIMEAPGKPVHAVVATGSIDRQFAVTELYPLARFLQDNTFWNAQIEQINVTAKQEIELVPRVGDHILFLGKPGDYNEKFSKLQAFYEKALSRVGWNKYERISLEFNNQIICTKKEK